MLVDSQHRSSGSGALQGNVAVVTGAARGIGLASARALGEAGARVILLDVLDMNPALGELHSAGIEAQAAQVDVSQRRQLTEAITSIAGGRLDILVTAAGIFGRTPDLESLDDEEVDRVLAVNFKGTLWAIQAALPLMRAHGGKIVCIGSVAGTIGSILSGVHYTASKGAIHAIVKWVAKREASGGIYANVIAPGVVQTDMTEGKDYRPDYCPLGRFGMPDDIAAAVVFLASPASNYITGTVLHVNGGFFMG